MFTIVKVRQKKNNVCVCNKFTYGWIRSRKIRKRSNKVGL